MTILSRAITVVLVACSSFVGNVQLQPDQAPISGRPEPVVDNGEFMDLFLKSTYGELQEAMAKPPADRKAWANIYQKAIRLEIGRASCRERVEVWVVVVRFK